WPCCGPPTTRWPPRRADSSGPTCRWLAGERRGGVRSLKTRSPGAGAAAAYWRAGGGAGARRWGPRHRRRAGAGAAPGRRGGAGGEGGGGSRRGPHIDAGVAEAAAPSSSLVLSRHGRLVVIVGSTGGDEADRVARALDRALGHRAGSGPADASEPGADGPP